MDAVAALALAGRIEAVWSDRPWHQIRLHEWTDALEQLDEGAAGTTFARLRTSNPKCPTIAEFVAATRQLNTHRPDRDTCPDCDDTSWVECVTDARHSDTCRTPDSCWCHAVTPCHTCRRTPRQENP